MNNRINASNWTQGLHQATHESQANMPNSFSELHPISNLTEYLAFPYHRVGTSATADLRNPSSTSGEVQLSGEHNNTALTQGYLEPKEPKQKFVPVPPEFRINNENEHTRISLNALRQRKHSKELVPVPPKYRLDNENEHTRISPNVLSKRKRSREFVPVPPEYRRDNENEHTRISLDALYKRKCHRGFVPVPPEYRRDNENEHSQISPDALYKRKQRKLKSTTFSGEKPHVSHQAEESSAANTLADSNSARQNSPILTRSPSGSNAAPLHETTPQDTMEAYESLPPFESETAFSHWLDDVNTQQSAIDYMLNCYWQNGIP
ncbi:MAG: hypothetical protein P8176_04815 [Gammaproteobacteria bacterium]